MLGEAETERHILGEFRDRDRETVRRDPVRGEMADVAQQDTVTALEGMMDRRSLPERYGPQQRSDPCDPCPNCTDPRIGPDVLPIDPVTPPCPISRPQESISKTAAPQLQTPAPNSHLPMDPLNASPDADP